MRPEPVLEQANNAYPGDGHIDGEVHRPTHADDERTPRFDAYLFSILLQVPRTCKGPAAEAPQQAGVIEQVSRMGGPSSTIEIGGCGSKDETLPAGSDRHCDHVLFQAIIVSDPGIRTGGEHVDETVLCDDLDVDLRVLLQETGEDFRKHHTCRRHGHVEPQFPCRGIAKRFHALKRVVDLIQCRNEPVHQPCAGFGYGHAPRCPVQEPHSEAVLQAADRLAERSGADTGFPRCTTEASGSGHCQEGIEIRKVRRHCVSLPYSSCELYRIIASVSKA